MPTTIRVLPKLADINSFYAVLPFTIGKLFLGSEAGVADVFDELVWKVSTSTARNTRRDNVLGTGLRL